MGQIRQKLRDLKLRPLDVLEPPASAKTGSSTSEPSPGIMSARAARDFRAAWDHYPGNQPFGAGWWSLLLRGEAVVFCRADTSDGQSMLRRALKNRTVALDALSCIGEGGTSAEQVRALARRCFALYSLGARVGVLVIDSACKRAGALGPGYRHAAVPSFDDPSRYLERAPHLTKRAGWESSELVRRIQGLAASLGVECIFSAGEAEDAVAALTLTEPGEDRAPCQLGNSDDRDCAALLAPRPTRPGRAVRPAEP